MPPKRPAGDSQEQSSKVYVSNKIEDRKSIFIGYYSPSVKQPAKDLQRREDVKSASHRIIAWRYPSSQQTLLSSSRPIYKSGHDDDGEQWAGRKLEKVMDELDVAGTVMVARWYGGELLGPVRFTHIENVAKAAVEEWRIEEAGGPAKRPRLEDSKAQDVPAEKAMRPEELTRRKKELIQTLQERDASIASLRTLLEQKKAEVAAHSSSQATSPVKPSPNRTLNYEVMPFPRLVAMENARDMSIGFLLKEINKAEADAKTAKEEAEKKAKSDAELAALEEDDELDGALEELEASQRTQEAARKAKSDAELLALENDGDLDEALGELEASPQVQKAARKVQSDAQLKAMEEDELDEAWEEMEEAIAAAKEAESKTAADKG